MKKRIGVLLGCLCLLCSLLALPAAAVEPGVYTASVVTTYYNPDTGNVDDGGTANAALGEGMCRSATGKTGLVEVDQDGNIFLTIRLLLQSNCKNVALYTRTGYNSYSQVSYTITSEDAGNDSIDYRFQVTDAGVKLKGTMYVTPMGRDVLWYLYVDTSTLQAGSSDFVVSIDTSAAAEPEAPEKQPEAPAAQPETPVTQPETPEAQPTASATTTAAEEPTDAPEDEETEDVPEEGAEETPAADDAEEEDPVTAEPEPEAESAEAEEETPEVTDSADQQEEEALEVETTEEAPAESESGLSGGTVAAIVVVVIVLAGAVILLVRRKRK